MPGKDLKVGLVVDASLGRGFGKTFRSTDDRLAKLKRSIKSTQDQAKQIQAFRKLQGGLIDAQAAARKAQDRVAGLGRAMRQAEAPTKKMRAELGRAHKEAHLANKRFEKQRRVLNEQRLAMKRAGLATSKLAGQEKRLGEAVEKTRRSYERRERSLARAQARKDRRGELRGRGLGMLGAAYTAGRIFEESFGIEEQAIRLETVINAEDGDVEAATGRALRHVRDVARRTLASESELLEIQYELNSAGLSESAARAGSEVASKVATVTRGDVGEVAKIMGGVFNNMGASIEGSGVEEKLGRIGDVLTKTQFKFQLSDFGQLGEGLGYAAAQATAARLSLEQTVAAIGMMNSAQVEGSRAGTALSAVLRQMGTASKELGFRIVRDADNNLNLAATLEGLRGSLSVYDDIDERNQMIQKVFGEEGMVGVVPLLERLDQYKQGLESVDASGGVVDEGYQKFLDSSGGQWKMFVQNVTAIGTALGDTLLPALNKVLTPLAEIAGWLGKQIEKWPELGRAIGTVAAIGMSWFALEYATGGLKNVFRRKGDAGAAGASRGLTSVAGAATQAAVALRRIGGGGPGGAVTTGTKGPGRGVSPGGPLVTGNKGRGVRGLGGRALNWFKGMGGAKGLGKSALSLGKGLGRGAPGLGVALGALSIGSTLLDSDLDAAEKAEGVAGDVGGIGGALAGAAAGAAIGSIVPGIGTAIGGIAGSIIGGLGGSLGGQALGSQLGSLFGSGIAEEAAALTPALATAGAQAASDIPLGSFVGYAGPDAASAPPQAAGNVDNSSHIGALNIYQQPGEDAKDLAKRVMREIAAERRIGAHDANFDD